MSPIGTPSGWLLRLLRVVAALVVMGVTASPATTEAALPARPDTKGDVSPTSLTSRELEVLSLAGGPHVERRVEALADPYSPSSECRTRPTPCRWLCERA